MKNAIGSVYFSQTLFCRIMSFLWNNASLLSFYKKNKEKGEEFLSPVLICISEWNIYVTCCMFNIELNTGCS